MAASARLSIETGLFSRARTSWHNGAARVTRDIDLVYLRLASHDDELAKLKPDLLNNANFVQAWITKLHPGDDEDWRRDPALTKACGTCHTQFRAKGG